MGEPFVLFRAKTPEDAGGSHVFAKCLISKGKDKKNGLVRLVGSPTRSGKIADQGVRGTGVLTMIRLHLQISCAADHARMAFSRLT
jgi:hypothetical protein